MELSKVELRLIRGLLEKDINRLEQRFRHLPDTAYTYRLRKGCQEAEALWRRINEEL